MHVAVNGSISARVIRAIEQTIYLGDRTVALETRLTCDLALGGFSRLKLAVYLEEAFDIELSDDVLERAITVADIVKYIGGHYFQNVGAFLQDEAA